MEYTIRLKALLYNVQSVLSPFRPETVWTNIPNMSTKELGPLNVIYAMQLFPKRESMKGKLFLKAKCHLKSIKNLPT